MSIQLLSLLSAALAILADPEPSFRGVRCRFAPAASCFERTAMEAKALGALADAHIRNSIKALHCHHNAFYAKPDRRVSFRAQPCTLYGVHLVLGKETDLPSGSRRSSFGI